MPLFGLNKRYDIPLVIGAGILVFTMFGVGYKIGKPKDKDKKEHGIEMRHRGGTKSRKNKKR